MFKEEMIIENAKASDASDGERSPAELLHPPRHKMPYTLRKVY